MVSTLLGKIEGKPIRHLGVSTAVDPHGLSRAAEIVGETFGRRSCYSDVAQRLIERSKACLVEFDVNAVAGVKALDMTFIGVAGCVQLRAAQRFREIRRQTLAMMWVQIMFEWMSRVGVL